LVEKWFVGGQVFVGAHNTDTGWLDSDTEVNIKQTYSFGMRAEIGSYVSDDILLYAYLGVINSAFNIDYGDAALRSSLRTSLWGISPGLGMGINLDSHWRLNLEAFYTFYERRMKEIDLGGAGTFQVQMEPRELGIAVGISRKLS
jgi:hypothetical protein